MSLAQPITVLALNLLLLVAQLILVVLRLAHVLAVGCGITILYLAC
jgi:hypothetical protein